MQQQSVKLRQDVASRDVRAVREIVVSTGFFSPAEVDVAVELIQDRIDRGQASDYRFIFADINSEPVGYACFGEIACTVGSYDLYWIVVHEKHRGQGFGRQLLRETESAVRTAGGRRIYVETSSRPQYQPTRAFYEKCGYRVETILDDFYAPGDGKVILVKALDSEKK